MAYFDKAKMSNGTVVDVQDTKGRALAKTNLDAAVSTLNSTITSKVNDEKAAREKADTAIRSALTAESNARAEEDAKLSDQITKALAAQYYANVKDFGAKGDGVTDDTPAIQNALNDGRPIVFPAGHYICSGAKFNSGAHLIGYGEAILENKTSNCVLINNADGVTGGYDATKDVIIEGLTLSSPTTTYTTILAIGHANNITIKNCVFDGLKMYHMIEFNGSSNCTVDGCLFKNYGDTTQSYTEIIQLDAMTDSVVFPWFGPYDKAQCRDIKIVNSSFFGNGTLDGIVPSAIGNHSLTLGPVGVLIDGCYFYNLGSATKFVVGQDIVISNNIVSYCHAGFYFNGSIVDVLVSNNLINGRSNWGSDSARGITTYLNGSHPVTNIVVTGNHIYNMGQHGISLQGGSLTIANNIVHNCGNAGMYTAYWCNDTNISSNNLYDNGQAGDTSDARNVDIYVNVVNNSNFLSTGIYVNNNKAKIINCIGGQQASNTIIVVNNNYCEELRKTNADKMVFNNNCVKGVFS